MARPRKQTVDYFPHYAGASNGKTLFILQSKFGNDGYATWFKLLELLASSEGHYFNYNNPSDWQFLLAKTGVSADILTGILTTLADVEAIDRELNGHKIIWSQNFVDNLTDLYKRRTIEFPRKPIVSANNNSINVNNNPISTSSNPQSKVKESKLNESKEEETTPLIPPVSLSLEQVIEVYEKNICLNGTTINEETENQLKFAVQQFSAPWVIDAIREACLQNQPTLRYIRGILITWQKEGKPK